MEEKSKIFGADETEWLEPINDHNGQVLYDKQLVNNPITGMQVNER